MSVFCRNIKREDLLGAALKLSFINYKILCISEAHASYMLLDNFSCAIMALRVISAQRGFSPLKHNLFVPFGGPLNYASGFYANAFDNLPNMDDALQYVTYILLDSLHYPILNFGRHVQVEGRSDMLKNVSEIYRLFQVFTSLP